MPPPEILAIRKFFREKSQSLSTTFSKWISSLKASTAAVEESYVTEFHLSGLKVIMNQKPSSEKEDEKKLLGRMSFFSRSNCRECTVVRSFLQEWNLNFVEINVNIFPVREKELNR